MAKKKRILLIWSVICLVCFILIMILVIKNTALVSLDHSISSTMSDLKISNGTAIMKIISFFASTIFVGFFSASFLLYFYFKKQKKEICSYLKTVFLGVLIGLIIKNIVQRTRPENLLETDYSFPSLHATASILLYGWLAFYLWKQGRQRKALVLLLVPLLIGFSRIYLGVHWFSDVLGGLLFGGGWLLMMQFWNNCSEIKSPSTVKESK